jgi:hypothetical protein
MIHISSINFLLTDRLISIIVVLFELHIFLIKDSEQFFSSLSR